jgi:hypothetical protein
MRVVTRARLVFCFVAGSFTCGCIDPSEQALDDQDPHQPGDALGAYAITGKLRDDGCGAASLNAPDRWSFEVKLSRLGSTLYWLNGREAVVGDIDSSGRFGFESRVDVPLTERHGAMKGCTVVRRDSASGSLSDSAESLRAVLSYAYEATSDSECSELIGADGAPLALPCSLTYSLSGARVTP